MPRITRLEINHETYSQMRNVREEYIDELPEVEYLIAALNEAHAKGEITVVEVLELIVYANEK